MKPVPTFRLRTLSVAVALASAAAVPVVYAQESSVNLLKSPLNRRVFTDTAMLSVSRL